MKFENYEFGFADATKEYSRIPTLFEVAFCDPGNIIGKLLTSYEYLLIGRKGVGKSAFCSKIQSLSEKSDDLYAFPMNLNDFEFSTFAKTGIDSNVVGTQKYKTSWDFILMLSIYKFLFNTLEMTESEEVSDAVILLDKLGFNLDSSIKTDVTKLTKIKIGAGIAKFDVVFEKEFQTAPSTYLERISIVNEKLLRNLMSAEMNDRKVVIIIDGFDDILRYKKNQMEIIASLIRSADHINDKLFSNKKNLKIILLIREDLIALINDPDLNKIIQDSSITISWNKHLSDLKELVNLRFIMSGVKSQEVQDWWYKIFPRKIRGKDSWEYVLDYTLYKPRDVLQFLKYCQSEFPKMINYLFLKCKML